MIYFLIPISPIFSEIEVFMCLLTFCIPLLWIAYSDAVPMLLLGQACHSSAWRPCASFIWPTSAFEFDILVLGWYLFYWATLILMTNLLILWLVSLFIVSFVTQKFFYFSIFSVFSPCLYGLWCFIPNSRNTLLSQRGRHFLLYILLMVTRFIFHI